MPTQSQLSSYWLVAVGALALGGAALLFQDDEPRVAHAKTIRPPAAELSCGAFVDSFAAMRAEAERIAALASATAIPLEEDVDVPASDAEIWREIAHAAQALNNWMWEARAHGVPLTLEEVTVVAAAGPLTSEIREESAAVAGDLIAAPASWDAASTAQRMQHVAQTASEVARALEPLAICGSAPMEITYAPSHRDCETLDPEYDAAMFGPCLF